MTSVKAERAYQQGEPGMRDCSACSHQQNQGKETTNENVTIQKLQRTTSLPQHGNHRKGAGDIALMHESGFPVLKIGNRMVVPKEKFICWVEENTTGEKPL